LNERLGGTKLLNAGTGKDLKENYEISKHFGLDIYYQTWCRATNWKVPESESHGAGIIKNGEAVLWITLDGFFWYPRMLFGIQNN